MFLYYLPAAKKPIRLEQLTQHGIGYAFERMPTACEVRGGPDGGCGLVVAYADQVERIGYYPARQEWRQVAGSSAWVGRESDREILPEDLLRRQVLRGHEVTLADGQAWRVPVARSWIDQDGDLRWCHALPCKSELDAEGHWVAGDVQQRFAALWQIGCRWFDARRSAVAGVTPEQLEGGAPIAVQLDFHGLHDQAVEVLSHNYRLGRTEAAWLGILDQDTACAILDATCDMPALVDWLEKKRLLSAGWSSADGQQVEIPDTDQP